MSTDPTVLDAIAAMVARDPANVALKMHLAELLVGAGRPAEADPHVAAVLALKPDDVPALTLAARVADVLGDTARASAYRRLLASATAPAAPAPPAAPAEPEPDT